MGFIISLFVPAAMKGYSLSTLHPLLFTSESVMFIGIIGVLLVVCIPALLLVFLGFRMLMQGHRRRIKGLGVSLLGLWVLGIIFATYATLKTVADFSQEDAATKTLTLTQPTGDTLYIDAKENGLVTEIEEIRYFGETFLPTDSVYYASNRVLLDIQKSESGEFELKQTLESRGRTRADAHEKATSIGYSFTQGDSTIVLNNFITMPAGDNFRGQQVRLTLKVPEGKAVALSSATANMLNDVKNVHDMYAWNMAGHTWMMNPEGLTCADCDSADFEGSSFQKGLASRLFDLKDFNEISVEGMFNLEIRQGLEFKVEANGNPNFIEHISISKSGNRLEIDMENYISRHPGTVTIVLPSLTGLDLAGATKSIISGFTEDKMRIEVMGASKVDMRGDVKELEMDVAGASKVTLNGKGEKFNIELNGASKLDAFGFEATTCTIEVNGTGKAEVNALSELTAEANGSSHILYKSYNGLPKISSDVSGISSIKPAR